MCEEIVVTVYLDSLRGCLHFDLGREDVLTVDYSQYHSCNPWEIKVGRVFSKPDTIKYLDLGGWINFWGKDFNEFYFIIYIYPQINLRISSREVLRGEFDGFDTIFHSRIFLFTEGQHEFVGQQIDPLEINDEYFLILCEWCQYKGICPENVELDEGFSARTFESEIVLSKFLGETKGPLVSSRREIKLRWERLNLSKID